MMDILSRLREPLVMSMFASREHLYQEGESQREAAAHEIELLRYVLGGVRDAIKTGRNEPLAIWKDQIDIALGEPKDR